MDAPVLSGTKYITELSVRLKSAYKVYDWPLKVIDKSWALFCSLTEIGDCEDPIVEKINTGLPLPEYESIVPVMFAWVWESPVEKLET